MCRPIQLVAEMNACIRAKLHEPCETAYAMGGHVRALYGSSLRVMPTNIPDETIVIAWSTWCETDP